MTLLHELYYVSMSLNWKLVNDINLNTNEEKHCEAVIFVRCQTKLPCCRDTICTKQFHCIE